MEIKSDKSFGVIPVFKNLEGNFSFCLVCEEDGHWGFPKGHQDAEESEEETAIRELKEETGINEISLNKKSFIEEYSFERDGFRFNKTVKYFLCFVYSMKSGTPDGFKKEIPELKWLRYEDAKQLITFPEAKGILDQTYQYLRS